MKNRYKVLITCMLATFSLPIWATHIVGGELRYRCLGGDNYEISLTVFRDCYYGEPPFDPVASIGVFNNGSLYAELLVVFPGSDTLEPELTGECYVIPPDVCVEQTTYITTVNLPFVVGGYTLAYQRCCRNQSILNIILPLDVGATYMTEVGELALMQCNSSATFVQWPPILICVGEAINFDHSATDLDGDSLVYRLCTPLLGASPDAPTPQPPAGPPYQVVPWQSPLYSELDMMGGVPLAINPVTGLLTGTPMTVGQFVVGICVDEYRNGELIGTTRRDFQYNVGICGLVAAAFTAPQLQCGGLEVLFVNEGLDYLSYFWQFGDPEQPNAYSTEFSPTFTFSAAGTYNVTLMAEPGLPCGDTLILEVLVSPGSIVPDFDLQVGCSDGAQVMWFTDNSTDSLYNLTYFEWDLYLPDGSFVTQTGPNFGPIVYNGTDGEAIAWLHLGNGVGCKDSTYVTVPLSPITDLILPIIMICSPDSGQLNLVPDLGNTYIWSPNTGLSSTTAASPMTFPPENTTYQVIITSPTFCIDTVSVDVIVWDTLVVFPTIDSIITCDENTSVTLDIDPNWSIFWARDADFQQIISDQETVLLEGINEDFTIFVSITTPAGCTEISTVPIQFIGSNLTDTTINLTCAPPTYNLIFEEYDPSMTLLGWLPEAGIESSNGPTAVVNIADYQAFMLIVELASGCIDTVNFDVLTESNFPNITLEADSLLINIGDTVTVFTVPAGFGNYEWATDQTTIWQQISTDSIRAALQTTTTFSVVVTDQNGCTANAIITIVCRNPTCIEPYVFIPTGFTPNGDDQNDIWQVFGDIAELEMHVYDRWGQQVFESKSPNMGWDGTFRGQPLAPDTYAFYMRAKCVGGTSITRQGNITLLR